MTEEMLIPYKLLDGAKAPSKSHFVDAGWDFYANEDVILPCAKVDMNMAIQWANATRHHYISGHELANILDRISFSPAPVTKVNLGVCISIPKEYSGIMFDRSGMGIKSHIGHVAGVMDCGYTGELTVGLINFGKDDYKIKRGDKIIQLVLIKTPLFVTWRQQDHLEETERGEKGFGSSDHALYPKEVEHTAHLKG